MIAFYRVICRYNRCFSAFVFFKLVVLLTTVEYPAPSKVDYVPYLLVYGTSTVPYVGIRRCNEASESTTSTQCFWDSSLWQGWVAGLQKTLTERIGCCYYQRGWQQAMLSSGCFPFGKPIGTSGNYSPLYGTISLTNSTGMGGQTNGEYFTIYR